MGFALVGPKRGEFIGWHFVCRPWGINRARDISFVDGCGSVRGLFDGAEWSSQLG